jgi:hypothetical protein
VAGRLGHPRSDGATTLKGYAAGVEAADSRAAEKPQPMPRPRDPYESVAADLRADVPSGRRAVVGAPLDEHAGRES